MSFEWFGQNFKAFDELLITQGTLFVALLRLTFAPFGVSNYVLGITSLTPCQFVTGSLSYIFNDCM
jgi:uncharacterized membrane protein YdjX (TVP38/TMEM64 family)